MSLHSLARALLARARPPRAAEPHHDRKRLVKALHTHLPPHLLKDVGAHDG